MTNTNTNTNTNSNTLYYLGVCVLGEGGGAFSIFRRRSVWLKLLHSIHLKAKSEKHIHNSTTIFYFYDCIYSMTSLNPA